MVKTIKQLLKIIAKYSYLSLEPLFGILSNRKEYGQVKRRDCLNLVKSEQFDKKRPLNRHQFFPRGEI